MLPRPNLSFEFFPPQSLDASFRLWDTVQTLAPLGPKFVSVTYGAGGTTRDLTHEAVRTIGDGYGLNVAAHLTCVEATRSETLEISGEMSIRTNPSDEIVGVTSRMMPTSRRSVSASWGRRGSASLRMCTK